MKTTILPVITGHISTFSGETHINVKMKPTTLVVIFITVWLDIVGLACLGIIFVGIIQFKQDLPNRFSPMSLIPFGMLLFGYLLTTLTFKAESKKARKLPDRLFERKVTL